MKTFLVRLFLLCMCCFLIRTASAAGKAPGDSSAVSDNTLPEIGLGYGALTFIGDIGNSSYSQPFLYRGGVQLDVQLHSKSNFQIFFNLLAGKVYGEEKSVTRNVNFMSNIFIEAANLRYSFISKKNAKQVLIPFISLGIENISFNPYTDLKDANGVTYNYWSDGTIRNIPETASDAAQSKIIRRDYTYETNVRDANLDSLGSFKQFAIAFPISIGVKFKISNRVSLNFTETYHITTTDNIDGITSKSLGSRAGNAADDKILYSSVSFHYDLSAPRETEKSTHANYRVDESVFKNINYDALENADSDGDGVPDFLDEDNSTPHGVKVDAHGRAIDSDGDGVPDYRDKEPNSPSGTRVDESGVAITDSMQEAKFIKDSLDMEVMSRVERIKSQNDAKVIGSSKGNIPDEYKIVDTNHDGIISADEIAKAIELYTSGKSSFTKQQFYRLVDYFFAQ